MLEEFLGDLLDAEGQFDIGHSRVCRVCLEKFEELFLSSVAVFVFPDEVAVTPCGGELRALGNDAKIGGFQRVVELDE